MVFPNNGNNNNRMLTSSSSSQNNTTNAFSQFETWSREQESFIQNANKAERERKQLGEKIVQMKHKQKNLTSQIRECQDVLGRYHRERTILMERKHQLQRTIKEERALLEESALEENRLILYSIKDKKKFCGDMEDLNKELSNLLLQQELNRIKKLITIDSVHVLKDHYQQKVARALSTSLDLSPDSIGCGDQNPEIILEELDRAVKSFIEIDSTYKKSIQDRRQLIEEINNHRKRLLNDAKRDGRSLTIENLLQMEQCWQNNSEIDCGSGDDENRIENNSKPSESTKKYCDEEMDIFYDNGNNSDENLQLLENQPLDG